MIDHVLKGPEIILAQDFLIKIYRDTKTLLKILDEQMTKKRYKAAFGNRSSWDLSKSWQEPDKWLMRFICRIYGSAENIKGTKYIGPGTYMFVGIYFHPIHTKKPAPIIVFGVLHMKKRSEAKDLGLVVTHEGPPFVEKHKMSVWGVEEPKGSNIDTIHFQVRPLIDIYDQQKVEEIFKALTNHYKQLRIIKAPKTETIDR